MTSWRTSIIGLVLILVGIGGMAFAGLDKVTGGIMITTGLGFLMTKDAQVTGGSIPQASPPGVAAKSDALGVLDAVAEIEKKGGAGIVTAAVKSEAQSVIATPSDVFNLTKGV